jgi:hypothetical protein
MIDLNENGICVKGTLRMLQAGTLDLEQAEETVNMWIELTARKFYKAGESDERRRNKNAPQKDWQSMKDMGM